MSRRHRKGQRTERHSKDAAGPHRIRSIAKISRCYFLRIGSCPELAPRGSNERRDEMDRNGSISLTVGSPA